MITISETFTFEAAHKIQARNAPDKYGQIHGHSHKVIVTLTGSLEKEGWIIEQSEFRQIVQAVIDRLDHKYLNEIMEQTTAEALAIYLQKEIKLNLSARHKLVKVSVSKTTSTAEWTCDD